ncbi:tRNA preQ1(34) S-adenosylmethionine ribosyltransferase-isomerase QueA [Helicobacter monodelphidis]|uniref:tRNA preQ1(34) S-adenosylmethionine ribosyltransferase-isomerase QueA n=1 Tax=Helicobacter sp. 15-1451 TaxID=2004995 RepID=UPI000DCBC3E9|nr:tRNA preQ1(34) S-adenosylmethionine ribosyltransferase-isomerase QueA [Helicobacter sp. 15-1451]RAX58374.1 tRNA preQ1(34) S-adenosylmethionine ribosyltransferase-isomerase QueA [Helicobacter sp. 15-1451]
MGTLNPKRLDSYDYALPKEQIALYPLPNKQEAKLLVYEKSSEKIIHSSFRHFVSWIPKDTLILCNDTRVLKARFYAQKPQTQIQREVLYHEHLDDVYFLAQIRKKVSAGDSFCLPYGYQLKIVELFDSGLRKMCILDSRGNQIQQNTFLELLEKIGEMPIPPYLKRKSEEIDSNEYQSVFAKNIGAVAAPTASLHFSQEDFSELQQCFEIAFVTLHIGAGTFMNVESEYITEHIMHKERFFISKQTLQKINDYKHILPIGTTAMRVLEEWARSQKTQGQTQLFLNPQNPPLKTQMLLTNFHLPKSSLFMLVSALVGLEQIHRIYAEAIQYNYRFYSYGDGMLIL